ncbi:MAG: transporter substrate-binding domain-containing protein [Anaerolineae bacterium]|nr:transporter substrate-binding domain-containing protein [Anaerolineae bacterium]
MRLPHRLFLIVLAGLVWLVGSYPLQARPADVVVPNAHQSRPQAQQSDEPLQVVTKVFEPFVIKDGDDFKGFSIDLWTEIVRRMGRQYEFIEVETVDDQLAAVAQGKADVAIAGITMTSEREHSVDFSYPYFKAGLQIMTRRERSLPFVNLMTVIFNPAMLEIVGIFFLIMLIAAHAVWLVERRNNPDFPQTYWRGIWEALWWSAVTVTTVGYGDKTPSRLCGAHVGPILDVRRTVFDRPFYGRYHRLAHLATVG